MEEGLLLLQRILPMDLIAPPDQRLNRSSKRSRPRTARGSIKARISNVTHVDIAASDLTRSKQRCMIWLPQHVRVTAILASRSFSRFNHPNHFNLVSAWLGEAPFRAFNGKRRGPEVPADRRAAPGLSVRRATF